MKCIYCNKEFSNKEKSGEHVIPQWILKYLDSKKHGLNIIPISKYLEVHPTRTLIADALKHNICATCNNGWLSKIDNSCIGLLKELMDSKSIDLDSLYKKYGNDAFDKLEILIYKIFLNFFATSPFREKKSQLYRNFKLTKKTPPGINFFLCLRGNNDKKISIGHSDIWNNSLLICDPIIEHNSPRIRFKFFIQLGNCALVMLSTGPIIKSILYDESFLIPLKTDNLCIPYKSTLEAHPGPIEDTPANRILWSIKSNLL